MPKSKNRRSTECSLLGMKMWRLQWKDTQLCIGTIKRTAAFLAKIAQHKIPKHAGGAEAWVQLHQSDLDSWHQNWHHIRPERHLGHSVIMRELMYPKSKVCHRDMCIYILLFPVLNFSILMHMPRIASVTMISIQICGLMKEHPLVSTLSAAW